MTFKHKGNNTVFWGEIAGNIENQSDLQSKLSDDEDEIEIIAGEYVAKNKVVSLNADGKAYTANSDNPDSSQFTLGIATNAANANQNIIIRRLGQYEDSQLNFTQGREPIFFNNVGDLTLTAPTSGFVQIVGFTTSTNSMIVNIQRSIIIG